MKKIFLYITVFILGAASVRAQDGLKLKIGYNTGMPIGNFKDFMGKNSFRGFHGELLYPVNNQFTVGVGVASQDYYEKFPRQLYDTKDGVISAVRTNSLQTTPILFKGNYNLTKEGSLIPYVGLGAGFNLVRYAQYLGEFGEAETSFKFAAAADAGANFFFNRETRGAGINLGVNFNYMPYNKNGIDDLHNWGVHAGVFFPLR
jgi:hypothetical protein